MFRWPDGKEWRLAALIFLVFAIASSSFGLASGLFSYKLIDDPYALLRTGAIALFIPALFEELLFRGPLIVLAPRFGANTIAALVVGSLALFAIWHPLNASIILTEAQDLFFDWRFLVVAFFLGIATTITAIKTRSVWPGVAIHWVAVMLWKALLDGPTFF